MERRLNLLFGIIGCVILIFLKKIYFGPFSGYVIDFSLNTLSLIGIIFIIYFCFILIIDTLKMLHKR